MVEAERGVMRLVLRIAAAAALVLLLGEGVLAAPAAKELRWEQLMPADPLGAAGKAMPSGIVQHPQRPESDSFSVSPEEHQARRAARAAQREQAMTQPPSSGVVPALDGERVRMRGFVVPLGFDGTKVKEFLLVPYAGACIHVPPPPANQIVFIEAAQPFEIDSSLFAVVMVTGTLRTVTISTELASIGYQLAAEQVERVSDR